LGAVADGDGDEFDDHDPCRAEARMSKLATTTDIGIGQLLRFERVGPIWSFRIGRRRLFYGINWLWRFGWERIECA
jgi:hypothetical protein